MQELTALIGDIQKFSVEDGPGVRTTVFIKGCPLNCMWCHNPELINKQQQMIFVPSKCIGCGECVKVCQNDGIKMGEEGPVIDWTKCVACGKCAENCYANAIRPVAQAMTVQDVIDIVLQDKEFYDSTGGGITISGGEILMHPEFVGALIDACSKEGIRVCLDTSGFGNYETIKSFAKQEIVKHILFDMKHIDPEKHIKYTDVDNNCIIGNLEKLASNPVINEKLWMRMPLMAGINDDAETIEKTKELYKELNIKRLTLIGYHELGKSKSKHIGEEFVGFKPPSNERMDEIKVIFESIGMSVEITGRDDVFAIGE